MKTLSSKVNELSDKAEDALTITPREKEILFLVSEGLSSRQIGIKLGISKSTVDNHRQRMLRKTHSLCTAQMLSFAFANKLI